MTDGFEDDVAATSGKRVTRQPDVEYVETGAELRPDVVGRAPWCTDQAMGSRLLSFVTEVSRSDAFHQKTPAIAKRRRLLRPTGAA